MFVTYKQATKRLPYPVPNQMEDQVSKGIHFKLPNETYEQFLRLFPGHGERSNFLRLMVTYAIQLGEEKDCFLDKIYETIRRDLDGGT